MLWYLFKTYVERFLLKDMFNFVICFNRSVGHVELFLKLRKWCMSFLKSWKYSSINNEVQWMHKNLTKWPSSLNCFVFTEFTNLQKNLQKIKGYRNSDLFGKSSKRFYLMIQFYFHQWHWLSMLSHLLLNLTIPYKIWDCAYSVFFVLLVRQQTSASSKLEIKILACLFETP